MASARPEDWFVDVLLNGVQRLFALALQMAPPSELIPLTAEVWADTLWQAKAWEQELDTARIAAAFVHLARICDRWPAPKQLLEVLPPRIDQCLLPHKISPEERARNQQRAQDLLDMLARKTTAP